MSGPAASDGTRARERVHAIDLLRVVASVQMILGHAIDALLAPVHRSGAVYETWTAVRGLTAVAFLFAAGASFALVVPGSSPARARRRVLRALGLIALSYALHPPVFAFSADTTLAASSLRELFAVDILACIGVTLLALEPLARLRWFALLAGLLAIAVLVASPRASAIVPAGALLPLTDYLTRRAGSLFPLFPFAGFALAGASLGSSTWLASKRLAPVGALLVAIGGWLAWASSPPEGAYGAWPALSFGRLGVVVVATALLGLATRNVGALPRWVTDLAGKSLFLYVTHLLALYVGGVGLARVIGPTLSVEASLVVAVGLAALTIGGALVLARSRAAVTRPG